MAAVAKSLPTGTFIHVNGHPCKLTKDLEVTVDTAANSAAEAEWETMANHLTGKKAPDMTKPDGIKELVEQTARETREAVLAELRSNGLLKETKDKKADAQGAGAGGAAGDARR